MRSDASNVTARNDTVAIILSTQVTADEPGNHACPIQKFSLPQQIPSPATETETANPGMTFMHSTARFSRRTRLQAAGGVVLN